MDIDVIQIRMVIELAMAAAVWPLLVGTYLVVGSRQSQEGQGTAQRLWLAAMNGATLASLPMLIWIVSLLPPYAVNPSFEFALTLTAVNAIAVGRCLVRPVRIVGSRRALPLVRDAEFLKRVREISDQMGIAAPRVRLLGSAAGDLETMAYVGGLSAPMVVMSDGAMHRLDERERDAIVAHEIAHIATGSLWWFAALVPLATVAASFAAAFLPVPVAAAFGVLFFVGIKRIVIRRFEFACDWCAGEVLGHREMAKALAKVHAAHIIPNKGLLSFLAYATGTHPPLAARIAALRDAAPMEDQAGIDVDAGDVSRHRVGSIAAVLLWIAALAAGWWIGMDLFRRSPALALLLGASVVPLVILLWSVNRKVKVASRRTGASSGGLFSLVVVVVCGGMALWYIGGVEDATGWVIMAGIFVVVFSAIMLIGQLSNRLKADVAAAIRAHEYERAVRLAEKHPKRVKKDPALRHNVALARGLMGDRQGAIDDLRGIVEDVPKFQLSALGLATLLLDEDPEESFEIAAESEKRLKRDPGPLMIQARALRRLGRPAEAQEFIARARKLSPDDGTVAAMLAGVFIDLEDLERAGELVEEAMRLAPGDAYCQLIAAEFAVARGGEDEAVEAVEKATRAAGHSPLAFLGSEIARLRSHPLVAERLGEAEDVVWAEEE